jgi:Ca2+-dependent lipid-binding protein
MQQQQYGQMQMHSQPAMGVAVQPMGVAVAMPMQHTLRVRVVSASSLMQADLNGKSDPYCILRWEGQPRPYTKMAGQHDRKVTKAAKQGKVRRPQTTVQKKTLNPHWNQTFDLQILQPVVQPSDVLTLEIYDYDTYGQHDFLGSVHVTMDGLAQGMERPYTLPVFTKKGHLTLALTMLTCSVPQVAPNFPNVVANKQIAAESARKRAAYS